MRPTLAARIRALLKRDSVRMAGVLLVAACVAVLYRDGSGGQAFAEPDPGRRPAAAGIGAQRLDGTPWRLGDDLGNVVVLNFWASWCPPCRAETPSLVRISGRYRDKGVRVVGVSMDDGAEPVRTFIARFRVPYTIVMPGDGGAGSGIESLPTTFLIDRHGRVAKTYAGAVEEEQLARDLDGLLREP